ncbi:PLP-dependent aminotransferase family protein [Streptococcus suis]|uniref:aminotransferase-like domain-containing protein n=1 Tax=Streptococcus suis TaxID=1307 RepID=UPI003D769C1B
MSIYQDIVADIIEGIETHRYKRGQKLPSIRQLSKEYGCSKDTVQKAMLELKYQHRIYAVEKSGYYILEDQDFQDRTVELNPEDFQQLPYEDFRSCLTESLLGRENYLFNHYHQQEGLEELRISLQGLLADYTVYTKKDQLVITAGSQQALYILSQMDFGEGRTDILLESPTYHRMQDLVERQGLPYQTIERTFDGINLEELEGIFQTGKIKFFYTIPRLHNPLGSSYDLTSLKKIVELAERYQVYLVEDDYLADFDSQHNLPLHYLDTAGRVIYIKSFTPTLFPALRLGGVALPKELLHPFLQYKSLIDYDTNLIMQKALSLYIDNGMFARNTRHLVVMGQEEEIQMRKLLAASQLDLAVRFTPHVMILEIPHRHPIPTPLVDGVRFYKGKQFNYLALQLPSNDSQAILSYLTKLRKKES